MIMSSRRRLVAHLSAGDADDAAREVRRARRRAARIVGEVARAVREAVARAVNRDLLITGPGQRR
jgi:hypothetical protein